MHTTGPAAPLCPVGFEHTQKLLQTVRSAAIHDLFHRIDGRHLSNNRLNSTIESCEMKYMAPGV